MKKGSVSLLALMLGLGSFEYLYADAFSALRRLKLSNPSSLTVSTGNETKLKEEISQLKAEILELRKDQKDPSLQNEISEMQSSVDKIGNNTPQSELVQLKAKIQALKKKNADLKKTIAVAPSNDPTTKSHISNLEAEIAKLRLQLAQSGKGTSTTDPKTEAEMRKEVTSYTTKLASELKDNTKKVDPSQFRDLLEKVETSGNPQILLDLESEILKLTQTSANPEKLEGINIILEKSDVLKKLNQQKQKAYFDSLADLGQKRLQELKAQLKVDSNYFKKSPFTILIFMNKSSFDFSVVQKSISTLMNQLKKTPQSDIQAIYSHLHGIGVDPLRVSGSSTFMQTLSQIMNSKTSANGLTEAEFSKLVSTNRQQLVDLINNISDNQMKEELKKLVSIGTAANVKDAKPVLELNADARTLQYFNVLKKIAFLGEQGAIVGANAIIDKLNTKPTASAQEKASAAIDRINVFLTAELKKPNLTENESRAIRKDITSIKVSAPTNAGSALLSGIGNASKGKIYAIGAEIPTTKTLKDDIFVTIKGREIQIQAEINTNKNKAKEVQGTLKKNEVELKLNDEIILAASYAALTSPTGTPHQFVRNRIVTTINPGLDTMAVLVATLKEIYQ